MSETEICGVSGCSSSASRNALIFDEEHMVVSVCKEHYEIITKMWEEKRKEKKKKEEEIKKLLGDMEKYPELKNSRGQELFDLVSRLVS